MIGILCIEISSQYFLPVPLTLIWSCDDLDQCAAQQFYMGFYITRTSDCNYDKQQDLPSPREKRSEFEINYDLALILDYPCLNIELEQAGVLFMHIDARTYKRVALLVLLSDKVMKGIKHHARLIFSSLINPTFSSPDRIRNLVIAGLWFTVPGQASPILCERNIAFAKPRSSSLPVSDLLAAAAASAAAEVYIEASPALSHTLSITSYSDIVSRAAPKSLPPPPAATAPPDTPDSIKKNNSNGNLIVDLDLNLDFLY